MADNNQNPADISEEELKAQARKMKVKYVNLTTLQVNPEIGQVIPEAIARRYTLVCISKLERKVVLAMADPLDVFAMDDAQYSNWPRLAVPNSRSSVPPFPNITQLTTRAEAE